MSHYSQAKFNLSAPDIALNRLTRQKSLARTSKTPGRTQLINVFDLDEQRRLIDLPGYGYAKVPMAIKLKWQKSLGEYLQKRESLKGLVVLMDIRHPFKDLVSADLPVLGLLTKADKFKSGKRKAQLLMAREASLAFCGDVTIHLFSSLNGLGLDNCERVLDQWFGYNQDKEPEQE